MDTDHVKRTLRELKRLEVIIRFGGKPSRPEVPLVWSRYFSTKEKPVGGVYYPLHIIAAMGRNEQKAVFSDYFAEVYLQHYRETGQGKDYFDGGLLAKLGLPPDAGQAAVKKRFRQLALETHPDTGGDSERFRALVDLIHEILGEK